MIRLKKPGTGIPASQLHKVVGRKTKIISGSEIRKHLINKETIPNYLMRESIAKLLTQRMKKSPETIFQS